MKYSYLKKRLDVVSPLLEERLRKYVSKNKAVIRQDNEEVLEVYFNCITDEIGNNMLCGVIYNKLNDDFGILI